MTKSEKARRAKAAAASRKYRAMKKKAKALARSPGDTVKYTKVRRKVVKNTASEAVVQANVTVSPINDIINTAVNQAADRVAARFGEKDHTDRLANEGGRDQAAPVSDIGAFSALMQRLDDMIERGRNIRNRQGDSLVESVGQREAIPTQGASPTQPSTASQPPRGLIIAQQINRLSEIIADLDAQSRIICNTLA